MYVQPALMATGVGWSPFHTKIMSVAACVAPVMALHVYVHVDNVVTILMVAQYNHQSGPQTRLYNIHPHVFKWCCGQR